MRSLEVRIVVKEILISLSHLHQQGMIHKDVKLENLVRSGGVEANTTRKRRSIV